MANNVVEAILESVTPEIYQRFKRAIESRRWPNGAVLTDNQLDTCMQAVLAYEHKHVPETLRTGYVPPKNDPCADKPVSGTDSSVDDTIITWR